MALTRDFKETIMELCKDPEYRKGLLLESLESYLEGDITTGNSLLKDYLNGTHAFKEVANELHMKETSVRRMVSNEGNGTAKNLFGLFKVCRKREGIHSFDDFFIVG